MPQIFTGTFPLHIYIYKGNLCGDTNKCHYITAWFYIAIYYSHWQKNKHPQLPNRILILSLMKGWKESWFMQQIPWCILSCFLAHLFIPIPPKEVNGGTPTDHWSLASIYVSWKLILHLEVPHKVCHVQRTTCLFPGCIVLLNSTKGFVQFGLNKYKLQAVR